MGNGIRITNKSTTILMKEKTYIYLEVDGHVIKYYSIYKENRVLVRNPFKLQKLAKAFGFNITAMQAIRSLPISLKKDEGYLRNIARYTHKYHYSRSGLTNQSWLYLMQCNEFIVDDWDVEFIDNKPILSIS